MIDVHPSPETALVDGAQAILPSEFSGLMAEMKAVAAALGIGFA
jgi:3-deoxy-7-phosphoheptulonate synthase